MVYGTIFAACGTKTKGNAAGPKRPLPGVIGWSRCAFFFFFFWCRTILLKRRMRPACTHERAGPLDKGAGGKEKREMRISHARRQMLVLAGSVCGCVGGPQ